MSKSKNNKNNKEDNKSPVTDNTKTIVVLKEGQDYQNETGTFVLNEDGIEKKVTGEAPDTDSDQ